MSSLRFCHERGQIKRWGAVRHVIVSRTPMRVFFILYYLRKNGVQTSGRFMFFRRFVTFFLETCFVPKVPQKCLGGVWDHPRPIRDNFRPILTTQMPKKLYSKNPYTNPYKNPSLLSPYGGLTYVIFADISPRIKPSPTY